LTHYSILNSNGLDVSGITILYGNTSLFSSLNVSGYTSLNNDATLLSSLNVSGFTTLNNNTTLLSSLNISGFALFDNNTTLVSSLNVSGFTTIHNNATLLSSLNVSGRTIIGNNNYNYSDSSFEVNNNLMIRNSTTAGSRIDVQVGSGNGRSYLSLEQDYDINLFAPSGTARFCKNNNNCSLI
jgi:acyl-[acyl carrier protein]--UDP-N-acetylglucosamine O-acyltransferase